MKKRDELKNRQSCLNKAKMDESLFVILGRDPAAYRTIHFWIRERVKLGLDKPNSPKLIEAAIRAEKMQEECESGKFRKKIRKKT